VEVGTFDSGPPYGGCYEHERVRRIGREHRRGSGKDADRRHGGLRYLASISVKITSDMNRPATAIAFIVLWAPLSVGQTLPSPEDKAAHSQVKAGKDGEVSNKQGAPPSNLPSTKPQVAPRPEPSNSYSDNYKGHRQGEPQGWFMAYVLLTGGITLCSFFATLAARKSANAAVKAANTAEKALKLSERADVLLEGASIRMGITQKVDGDSQVILSFRNFGRTRAQNVRFDISLEIPGVPKSIPPQASITVGAGDTRKLCFPRFAEFLTKETAEGISRGDIPLGFRGIVTYKDAFDDPHTFQCGGTLDHITRIFRMDEHREQETLNQN
jgi:hypothetical protein